ncbi:Glycosyltransferase involved in cell wall bisynthesis [Prevotellaceae bacterium HUN156]|nr:Glycosyltransferase involved in cell wall bisynthesis [Prevotellaceae bacterium HUN156]
MHKISIIIPVYNVRNYIRRCLESIILQECTEVDIECILVDDCSPDDSMEIAASVIDDYNRKGGKIQFEMMHLPENRGHCAARNAAVRKASGDYFLFVDSDDYLEQDAVKSFVAELDSADWQPEVVMGNALSTYDKRLLSKIPEKKYIDNSNQEGLNLILNRILFNTSWNKLVKAKVFTEYGLYFAEGIINEDLLWSYMLFLRARNILLLPRITYIYEDSNQQSITNTNTTKKLLKFIRSRIFICNQIFSNPPRIIPPDYYGYLFCILHRMVDVLESQINAEVDIDTERHEIYQLRRRLLHSTWKSGYPLLCCLIFTLYKPFYYIVKLKAFRNHFNNIIRAVVAASRKFHF